MATSASAAPQQVLPKVEELKQSDVPKYSDPGVYREVQKKQAEPEDPFVADLMKET